MAMMKQITTSTLAAIALGIVAVSAADAKLATNGPNLNGRDLQGVQVNGISAHTHVQPARPTTVNTVILPSGETVDLR